VCATEVRDFTWGHYHRLCRRDRLVLGGLGRAVRAVGFGPDGRTLVGCDGERIVRWDADTGRELASFHVLPRRTTAVALGPDGRADTGRERLAWQAHDEPVDTLAAAPDGDLVVSGAHGVKLWDPATGRERASSPSLGWAAASALAVSPDGERLAVGDSTGV